MSKYFLVKFKSDWADEFDVYGFQVMTEDSYKEWVKQLNEVKWPKDVYFGTNEGFDFRSLEDYQRKIEIKEIDEKEYSVLQKFFDQGYMGVHWGNFIDPTEY